MVTNTKLYLWQQPNATEDTHLDANDVDEHDRIEDWSPDQLRERTKQIQMAEASNGHLHNGGVKGEASLENRNCESRMEEINLSEVEEESKSASKSTTSDSQVRFNFILFYYD